MECPHETSKCLQTMQVVKNWNHASSCTSGCKTSWRKIKISRESNQLSGSIGRRWNLGNSGAEIPRTLHNTSSGTWRLHWGRWIWSRGDRSCRNWFRYISTGKCRFGRRKFRVFACLYDGQASSFSTQLSHETFKWCACFRTRVVWWCRVSRSSREARCKCSFSCLSVLETRRTRNMQQRHW